MKEAFGGTFTLKLLMVFFVIYVTFLGVALQIAKAYRIKNGVINYLEQNRYIMSKAKEPTYLDSYLDSIPYNTPKNDVDIKAKCDNKTKNGNKDAIFYHGVCITEDPNGKVGSDEDNSHYYKVTVYVVAEFPFFGIIGRDAIYIPVSGETMTIKEII